MFKQINKPKSKYKDTEGLGHTIPIENVAGLVTSIGIAALTGGAAIATEAGIAGAYEGLVAGGLRGAASGALRGVSAAGNSIKAATVAGGVAGAVNQAVGGGPVGNVLSGVAGGLASRHSGSITTRISGYEPIEQTAFTGQGNRVGGSRTVSRLVQETPPDHNLTLDHLTKDKYPE